MRIEAITTYEAFANLKENWEAVYAADPEAQFFLSWTWLSGWLKELSWHWIILAAKPTAEASTYVAFFPLKYRAKKNKQGGTSIEIAMAGNRAADYTGFICIPEFQDNAVQAFAISLESKKWNSLHLENLLVSDQRFNLFLKHFPRDNFARTHVKLFDDVGNIDNNICPYVSLPTDWESYLNNALSTNTRQKVRRFLRKIETCGDVRITHAETDTIEDNLDMLLQFWVSKWGERKGDRLDRIVNVVRNMLTHCFDKEMLFLPVLWKGEMPVGALASLIDKEKRSLLFYIAGRDPALNNPPPGFILHAYSIRYAISNGFTTYDFLRGNEPYKYLFGSEERYIRNVIVRAKNTENTVQHMSAGAMPATV